MPSAGASTSGASTGAAEAAGEGVRPMEVDVARTLRPFYGVHHAGRCNLRCFYCYEDRGPFEPGRVRAAVEASLRRAARAGYRDLFFESGELLLLPFWRDALRRARRLRFEHVGLVTNLTLLDERHVAELAAAGLDVVAGTFFALSDAGGRRVAGRAGVFTRQRRAVELVLRQPGLRLVPHLMLTRETARRPLAAIRTVQALVGSAARSLIVSAVEPVSAAVLRHPDFVHGLDLDWEELIEAAERLGVFVVVQNVPACVLGRYAHRNLLIRKRVGRLLEGWPTDPELVRAVVEAESLHGRVEPTGLCRSCRLLAVCQRFYDYPIKRRRPGLGAVQVVRTLLAEERLAGDPGALAAELRRRELRR